MDKDIKVALLRKMYSHRIIGGKHTAIKNLPKGFPPKLHPEVIETAKELIKEGFIIKKPTSYGFHVSLNPRRIKEIEKLIF